MAGAARDADLPDDRQDQILRGDPGSQATGDVDSQRLRLALQQALRGEHVTDFGGSDSERQGAQGAVRAGMTVAAYDGLARLSDAQLGADDMYDSALFMAQAQKLHVEGRAILLQLANLSGGGVDCDRRPAEHLLRSGRRRMVHRCQSQVGAAHG